MGVPPRTAVGTGIFGLSAFCFRSCAARSDGDGETVTLMGTYTPVIS
jgi:hypothetical protein